MIINGRIVNLLDAIVDLVLIMVDRWSDALILWSTAIVPLGLRLKHYIFSLLPLFGEHKELLLFLMHTPNEVGFN